MVWGEVGRAEKRWRTTEKEQQRKNRKKLQNNETNMYAKETEENRDENKE